MKTNLIIFFCLIKSCLSLIAPSSSSNNNVSSPKCLHDQTSILLQFKQEFSPDFDDYADPKTENWNNASSDCCSWDGIECDGAGHVVGLDLSNGSLRGPLTSNSSLFRLTRLQSLNLGDNDFNHSRIPPRLGRDLPLLTRLNLARSSFSGPVPGEISWLKSLVSLDLSSAVESDSNFGLFLGKEVMTGFIRNLTGLKELGLNAVNLSAAEAEAFGNFTSVETLSLSQCDLAGEFPDRIFRLPNIRAIYAPSNARLRGFLPEFLPESKLESVVLESTGFSGALPGSIGNLKSLTVLNLADCGFSGSVPSSLGNLSELTRLDLSQNNFSGGVPSSLGGLTRLESLSLSKNRFGGEIPPRLGNLTRLTDLQLSFNEFAGEFPAALANLTKLDSFKLAYNRLRGSVPSDTRKIPSSASLTSLDLSNNLFNGTIPPSLFEMPSLTSLTLDFNRFSGSLSLRNVSSSRLSDLNLRRNGLSGKISSSISNLTSLEWLQLGANEFSGTFDFEKTFSKMTSLTTLELSYNERLSIVFADTSSDLPRFSTLGLASCNIIEFPKFLRNQTEIWQLDLTENRIEGPIPKWFLATGTDSLAWLYLSRNLITGWEQQPSILPWNNLNYLDLHGNRLRGSLSLPKPSMMYYFVSNNSLTGEVDPSFCELPFLEVLDASDNNLSGDLPPCLGLNNTSLRMLNLKRNGFGGKLPEACSEGSSLQTIDLSHNELRGTVPRSLAKCKELEVLNIGHNRVSDEFPFWTQSLPKLQVLVLRNNEFRGPIWHPRKFLGFDKLRIIDLSFNSFSGILPPDYFRNWAAINSEIPRENKSELRYMGNTDSYYQNSLTLASKGLSTQFTKILTTLMVIDLSNNRFRGRIPITVGGLKSLKVLNLSGNGFEGLIQSSLGSLTELESLDLSKNKLSGEIPSELMSLTFLSYLNLSENNLSGKIPEGRQFDTFTNSSYRGNLRLCGSPLTKRCGTADLDRREESRSENGFEWKAVPIGIGFGLVIGSVVEHFVGLRRPNWLPGVYMRMIN